MPGSTGHSGFYLLNGTDKERETTTYDELYEAQEGALVDINDKLDDGLDNGQTA